MEKTTGLIIERLNHEGRGVAHLNGKTCFIEGGLPGEQVTAEWMRKHKRYNEGLASAIENTPSPLRITPFCPHFEICGGCSLQYLDPSAQLAHKEQVLLEQLTHFANLQPKHVLSPVVGPLSHYRPYKRSPGLRKHPTGACKQSWHIWAG